MINMTFEEVKSRIEEISAAIINIEEKDFDDIKDVEIQEGLIRELIFDYCVAQKYEIEGFPFIHLKKVEDSEPGYDKDYLTPERMDYYIERLALEKEDVFELCFIHYQHYFSGLNPLEVRHLIKDGVAQAEQENLRLDLTEEEIEEATRVVPPYRPKWPG